MTLRSSALAATFTLATAMTAGAAAQAATSTASMLVTASVAASCVITANPLPFGTYSTTAASTANTTIGVVCTNGTPYNVGLNAGTGTGASGTTRLMTQAAGVSTLAYNIYSDAGLSTLWGNAVGTNTVAGTGHRGSARASPSTARSRRARARRPARMSTRSP